MKRNLFKKFQCMVQGLVWGRNVKRNTFPGKLDFIPKQYFVCYLDILGTRNSILKGIDYHDDTKITEEQKDRIYQVSTSLYIFLDLIKRANDITKDLQYSNRNIFTSLLNFRRNHKTNTPRYLHDRIYIQNLSDSLLIYFPLNKDDKKSFQTIAFICNYLSFLFLKSLSLGVQLRGAISIGVGWEIKENYLFGPVIHEVHEYESSIAHYSRIVVSSSTKNRIDSMLDKIKRDNPGIIDKDFIIPFICYDKNDKTYMLDYLLTVLYHWVKDIATSKGPVLLRPDTRSIFDILLMIVGAYNSTKDRYLQHKEKARLMSNNKESKHEAELALRSLFVLDYFKSRQQDLRVCISRGVIRPFKNLHIQEILSFE